MSAPPNRFSATLCCVLGHSALQDTLASALLLSHHPGVCRSERGARSLWRGIVRRAYGGAEGIDRLLQDANIAADVTRSILQALQARAAVERCVAVGDEYIVDSHSAFKYRARLNAYPFFCRRHADAPRQHPIVHVCIVCPPKHPRQRAPDCALLTTLSSNVRFRGIV